MTRRRSARRSNRKIRRTRRVKEEVKEEKPVRRTGRRRGRTVRGRRRTARRGRRGRTVRGRTARRGRTVRGRTAHRGRRGRTVRIGVQGESSGGAEVSDDEDDEDLDKVWELVEGEVAPQKKKLSKGEFMSRQQRNASRGQRLAKNGYKHDDTFLAHGTLVQVKVNGVWRNGEYRGFREPGIVSRVRGKPNYHIIYFNDLSRLETWILKGKDWNYGITVNGFALLSWIWNNWDKGREGLNEGELSPSDWYLSLIHI